MHIFFSSVRRKIVATSYVGFALRNKRSLRPTLFFPRSDKNPKTFSDPRTALISASLAFSCYSPRLLRSYLDRTCRYLHTPSRKTAARLTGLPFCPPWFVRSLAIVRRSGPSEMKNDIWQLPCMYYRRINWRFYIHGLRMCIMDAHYAVRCHEAERTY